MRICYLIAFLAIVGLPTASNAALSAYEGFDYPSGSPVLGQNGGFGWAGPWEWTGGGLGANITPGLSFSNLASLPGSVTSDSPSPGTVAFYLRSLTSTYGTDNTVAYISFLLRPEAEFGFYGGINLGGLFIGKSGGAATYSLEAPTDVISSSAVAPIPGVTVFLVLKAEFLSGVDRFSLFVNPTPGGPEPGSGSANAVKMDYNLDATSDIVLNNAGGWTTDEIRIGSTFADVTPAAVAAVPEPGSMCLFATLLSAVSLRARAARAIGTKTPGVFKRKHRAKLSFTRG